MVQNTSARCHKRVLLVLYKKSVLLGVAVLVAMAANAFCQSDALWTGHAQCQLTMQERGYAHQEVQTWTITGNTQSAPGSIQAYPASWTVTGGGSVQRMQGTQPLAARWNTNVPAINGTLAIFVRASDKRLVIKSYHAQLVAPGGISTVRQVGGAQTSASYEWQFPVIEADPDSSTVSGTGTVIISGGLIPMQSPSTNNTANCKWEFSKGGEPSATPRVRVLTGNPQGMNPGGLAPGATTVAAGATPATQAAPEGTAGGTNTVGSKPAASQAALPGTKATPNLLASLIQISPTFVKQGQQGVTVALTGRDSNFRQGVTTADFGPGISVVSVLVTSPTSAKAVLNIDRNAGSGYRTVTLTTGNEHASGMTPTVNNSVTDAPNEFQVVRRYLYLASTNPASVAQGQQGVSVDLTGHDTSFQQGVTTADFGAGISLVSLTVHSPTTATAVINVDATANIGGHNVVLTTGTEQASTNEGLALKQEGVVQNATDFQVRRRELYLTAASPASIGQGQQNVSVDLTGHDTSFQQGVTTADFGAGISLVSLTVHSPTTATAVINVDATANIGGHNVVLTTGTEQASTNEGLTLKQEGVVQNATGFQVRRRELYLTAASPASIGQGQQNVSVDLTGHDTSFQQGVTTADFGAGISLVSLTVHSPTTATAVINVDATANIGGHNVVLTTGTEQASTNEGLALKNQGQVQSATGFQITRRPLQMTSVSPANIAQSQQNSSQQTSSQAGASGSQSPGTPVSYVQNNVAEIWAAKQCTSCHFKSGTSLNLSDTSTNTYQNIRALHFNSNDPSSHPLLKCSTNTNCVVGGFTQHPGGQGIAPNSAEYTLILQWILDGMNP